MAHWLTIQLRVARSFFPSAIWFTLGLHPVGSDLVLSDVCTTICKWPSLSFQSPKIRLQEIGFLQMGYFLSPFWTLLTSQITFLFCSSSQRICQTLPRIVRNFNHHADRSTQKKGGSLSRKNFLQCEKDRPIRGLSSRYQCRRTDQEGLAVGCYRPQASWVWDIQMCLIVLGYVRMFWPGVVAYCLKFMGVPKAV